MSTSHTLKMEEMRPDEFAAALAEAPVAYVPMGTLEFHGFHLPIGNDALKAHGLALRAAAQTGGVVLPAQYWGTGGGHAGYDTSIIVADDTVRSGLRVTLERLVAMGFRAIVVLTGHYPGEQVAAVKEVAAAVSVARPAACKVWALAEPEAYPHDERRDHAALWETSILMDLRPELVSLEALGNHASDPLYGVFGTDPRQATPELGKETVDVMVHEIVRWVREALA